MLWPVSYKYLCMALFGRILDHVYDCHCAPDVQYTALFGEQLDPAAWNKSLNLFGEEEDW